LVPGASVVVHWPSSEPKRETFSEAFVRRDSADDWLLSISDPDSVVTPAELQADADAQLAEDLREYEYTRIEGLRGMPGAERLVAEMDAERRGVKQ